MKTLNIIGCGAVATQVALAFKKAGLFSVHGLYNRTPEKAQTLKEALKEGEVVRDLSQLPLADFWMVGLSEPAFEVAKHIAPPVAGTVVFHVSGMLGASALEPLGIKGAHLVSAHPIRSFPKDTPVDCQGMPVSLEGDAVGISMLAPYFKAIGAHTFNINSEHKTLYHAACVMASGLLGSVFLEAARLLTVAGVDSASARAIFRSLSIKTVENVAQKGAGGLTGPIVRKATAVIAAHEAVLAEYDKEAEAVYRVLSGLMQRICLQ